jgi:hypothetical protein
MPPEGGRFALVPSGPSLSFRDLGAWAANQDGVSSLAARLRDRPGPDGVGVPAAVLVLWSLAALAIRPARGGAAAPLPLAFLSSVATELIPGATLIGRASVLTPAAPWMTGVLAAVLAVIGVSYGLSLRGALRRTEAAPAPASPIEQALVRCGTLLVRFERWVVDAVIGAAAGSLWVLAWIAARVDTDVVDAPVERLAGEVDGVASRLEPLHGGSLERVAWCALALGALAVAAISLLRGG